MTEVKVLQECNNLNVIKYVDHFHTDEQLFIVTEFCNGGDLEDYIRNNGKLTEKEALGFLKNILNGFKGLH